MKKYIITLPIIVASITLFSAKGYAEPAFITHTDTIYALCESTGTGIKEVCTLPSNTLSVTWIKRYSNARCDEGTPNFSYSKPNITVNNGCRAKYRVKLSTVVKVQTINCSSLASGTGAPYALEVCSFDHNNGLTTTLSPIWKEHRVSKAACKGVGNDTFNQWFANKNKTWGVLNYPNYTGFTQNTMYTTYGCRGTFSQVIQ